MIPYSRQSIDKRDIAAIHKVLNSDWLTQGPKVREFEEALAKEIGAKFVVTFSSGTAALEAAYFSAGVKKGDEIITSPLTFAATANAALWTGAKVVFADVEKDTGNLDPKDVLKKVTARTKAIVPVDYAGLPAKLNALRKIAKDCSAILIEDAAHSLGARYYGKNIGGIADMTMLSFHPVKSITTGEGGAVSTQNRMLYERLKLFREHGITKDPKKFLLKNQGGWYYEMQELGHNYRLTDIQATLGISQLGKLHSFITRRRSLAKRYHKAFSVHKDLIVPVESGNLQSSWHLYPLRLAGSAVRRRAEIFKKLRESGIGVQVHYIPVYLHPFYRKLGYKRKSCPEAEAFYEAEISLPLFPELRSSDQKKVIKMVRKYVQEQSSS